MKISELIEKLEEVKAEHGDIAVLVDKDTYGCFRVDDLYMTKYIAQNEKERADRTADGEALVVSGWYNDDY